MTRPGTSRSAVLAIAGAASLAVALLRRGLVLLPQLYLLATGPGVPVRHAAFSAASPAMGVLYIVGTLRESDRLSR